MGSSISSQDAAKSAAPLKIAIDTGDARKVEAYQKYKGLNDLNLSKRSGNDGPDHAGRGAMSGRVIVQVSPATTRA